MVISEALFGKNFTRRAIALGHVLDGAGRKASKSRGNVLDPALVFDRFGADSLRWWFYTSVPLGRSYQISFDSIDAVARKFLRPLWNVFVLFDAQASWSHFEPRLWPPSLGYIVALPWRRLLRRLGDRPDEPRLGGSILEHS